MSLMCYSEGAFANRRHQTGVTHEFDMIPTPPFIEVHVKVSRNDNQEVILRFKLQ